MLVMGLAELTAIDTGPLLEEHDQRANGYALERVPAAEDVCVLCKFPSEDATRAVSQAGKLFGEYLTLEYDFGLNLQ